MLVAGFPYCFLSCSRHLSACLSLVRRCQGLYLALPPSSLGSCPELANLVCGTLGGFCLDGRRGWCLATHGICSRPTQVHFCPFRVEDGPGLPPPSPSPRGLVEAKRALVLPLPSAHTLPFLGSDQEPHFAYRGGQTGSWILSDPGNEPYIPSPPLPGLPGHRPRSKGALPLKEKILPGLWLQPQGGVGGVYFPFFLPAPATHTHTHTTCLDHPPHDPGLGSCSPWSG